MSDAREMETTPVGVVRGAGNCTRDAWGYGEQHSSLGTFVVRSEGGKDVEWWGSYGWGTQRVSNARRRIRSGHPSATDKRLHRSESPYGRPASAEKAAR